VVVPGQHEVHSIPAMVARPAVKSHGEQAALILAHAHEKQRLENDLHWRSYIHI
jgi:hypothetical protein